MKRITAPVISNRSLMPETYLLEVDAPPIAAEARPGQFCMVHCGEGYFLRRPLSIHRAADGLAFWLRVVGRGSAALAGLHPGDKVDIIGPLGNGYSVRPGARSLLLVAGGMGAAPLAFLARKALREERSVTLVIGGRTRTQIYPVEMLPAGLHVVVVTEDGSQGEKGLLTDFLPGLVRNADQIFSCGPVAMYRAMRQIVVDRPVQVSMEAWMGCGMGACYACTTLTRQGPKQVCRDGPVFDIQDILWDEI
ncbi:MAG: dihydroorotate dehydrogenase electron transfer subunit [Chloroflexi bacterium]|nr:dihydroorotate dehydrogenase electron transfer subunit [Chloroflexota bacterium]